MKNLCHLLAAALLVFAAETAKAGPMLTPWGEKVTSENAWRGYPRPQMARANWTCLNGDWDYAITAITNTPGRPVKWDGRIRVPFALEAPLSGCGGRLLEPDEYLWYTREIDLDPKPGERILLHFGAVDFRAIVYLGHDEVALHEGGQLPFTADLTPFAKKGANTLTVLVWDPTEDFIQSRGKQAFKTHACFYTRSSGITQTVWLETVPETYIADYDVTTDIDKGEVSLKFKIEGTEGKERTEGTVEIENPVNPDRFAARPSASANLTTSSQVHLVSALKNHSSQMSRSRLNCPRPSRSGRRRSRTSTTSRRATAGTRSRATSRCAGSRSVGTRRASGDSTSTTRRTT